VNLARPPIAVAAPLVREMCGPGATPAEGETVAPTPLSPARSELAAAIEQLRQAQHEAAVAAGPANRLHQVVADLERAETELAGLRAEDERLLGAWLADGAETARPQPSPATLTAERKLAQLVRDGAAARSALPLAENVHKIAAERVTTLGSACADAAFRAAVEAARAFVAGPYRDSLVAALRHENRLRSLSNALRVCRHSNSSSPASSTALGCANEIDEAIGEARRAAAIEHDFTTGRTFLNALIVDPMASLVPQS
jgi:hypothetical protein